MIIFGVCLIAGAFILYMIAAESRINDLQKEIINVSCERYIEGYKRGRSLGCD